MRRGFLHAGLSFAIRLTARQRGCCASETAFIVLAALAGLAAGFSTNLLGFLAHAIQQVLYGLDGNRLSALGQIRHPWRLLALPAEGALRSGRATCGGAGVD
jgi:CIC family chloride channel protein